MNNAKQIKDIADKLVSALGRKGFIIQRYDAFKTDSVYLKLDYGVCNSIRISDHPGKQNLQYRYNVIIGGELNITEDVYIRYFYKFLCIISKIKFACRFIKTSPYCINNYICKLYFLCTYHSSISKFNPTTVSI